MRSNGVDDDGQNVLAFPHIYELGAKEPLHAENLYGGQRSDWQNLTGFEGDCGGFGQEVGHQKKSVVDYYSYSDMI